MSTDKSFLMQNVALIMYFSHKCAKNKFSQYYVKMSNLGGKKNHPGSIYYAMRNSRFSDHSVLCTASVQVQVEPVGRWFEAYVRRRNRSTSASFQELEEEEESSEESEDEEFHLEECPMLRTLDPKDWKVSSLSWINF